MFNGFLLLITNHTQGKLLGTTKYEYVIFNFCYTLIKLNGCQSKNYTQEVLNQNFCSVLQINWIQLDTRVVYRKYLKLSL